jgi:hypothetical protein
MSPTPGEDPEPKLPPPDPDPNIPAPAPLPNPDEPGPDVFPQIDPDSSACVLSFVATSYLSCLGYIWSFRF